MPLDIDTDETENATPPDLGPEFNAAREHLRATVLDVIDDGMHDGDPLKCLVTVATALLGAATIERDALAAEVERLTSANERMSSVLSLIDRAELRRAKRGAADS